MLDIVGSGVSLSAHPGVRIEQGGAEDGEGDREIESPHDPGEVAEAEHRIAAHLWIGMGGQAETNRVGPVPLGGSLRGRSGDS